MSNELRLMTVVAHPDDESLGMGGTLAKYAAAGVETCVISATRGERGRFGNGEHRPGLEAVGKTREAELRAAGDVLGVAEVHFLDYIDGDLDRADPEEAIARIAAHLRRFRPHVVVTFAPDGAYGHPDHIAISQFTAAAIVAAANGGGPGHDSQSPHRVSKFYYMAWPEGKWKAYQSAFRKLTATVDGVSRQAVPWPDWAITTIIDTEQYWPTVWSAVSCHKTQLALYGPLEQLTAEHHRQLWGTQEFYRVFSLVNGGRRRETDLFDGLRGEEPEPRLKQSAVLDEGRLPDTQRAAGSASSDRGTDTRNAPLEMTEEQFRGLGHTLVDQLAEFLGSLRGRPVTVVPTPDSVRRTLAEAGPFPERGSDPRQLLAWVTERLVGQSLHNGHPRFWGYITSSAAPIGMLADFLAAGVNANVGAWTLSPVATEIEVETVRWIAELLGYPADCGGLLVSGGNVANLVALLAARRAKADWNIREEGLQGGRSRTLRVYASTETHTWLQKAADISGLGTNAIRWIPADREFRIQPSALRKEIEADLGRGERPFLVVGSAGTVSTGAVDPLRELAAICREFDLWFHVDGAYGAPAAIARGAPPDLAHLNLADSIAVDPHKWLYAPLEAGCVLVSRKEALRDAFSYHPAYYNFDQEATNYFDFGIQNSRGFRALKVWLALRQVGLQGYRQMISDDIRLAQELYRSLSGHPTLEPLTQGLSITTFRYIPQDLRVRIEAEEVQDYVNELNRELLARLEDSGELFLSNALINGKFALRLCIVNFRTTVEDIRALPEIVHRLGTDLDSELRDKLLRNNERKRVSSTSPGSAGP